MGLISLLRATALVGVATSSALPAQGQWTCPDNGTVVVASNQGTGNVSYTFKMNVNQSYDQSLVIHITERDKDGNRVVVQTIEWQSGTAVAVTIGPGRSIEIEDPDDTDSLYGTGSFS